MRLILALTANPLLSTLRKRWVEWTLSFTLLIIGCFMVYGGDAMNSERYAQLTNVAPASAWSLVVSLLGSARMAILYFNGRWNGSYMARVTTAIMSMGIWYNFALLAWVNLDNILIITLPLAILPLLLEGLAVVFALQERVKSRDVGFYAIFPSA